MRIELTAEELQVFAIAFDGKPFEVEDVFKGKSHHYIQKRINKICKSYIDKGILGSQEFETLMNRFLFARKILSVFSQDTYWLSIMSSDLGMCARYYNSSNNKYTLWTLNNDEEVKANFVNILKLPNVSAAQKIKKCYFGQDFSDLIERNFDGIDSVEKKIYNECVNNDLKLVQESNEYGYDMVLTTQFSITNNGIEYLKAQYEEERYFVEVGITDTDGLVNVAFYENRKKE